MKFLVISDIHGNIENIEKLENEFKNADAVLFAGDFAEFGKEETGLPALKALCKKHETIFSVIGNCDKPEFLEELEKADISVQKQLVMHEGLAFAGAGGGTIFTKTTANERTEEDILSDFKIIEEQGDIEWDNLVAIMHNPPKDTDCDAIPGGIHVGSQALRDFIEKYKPLAVITGHIHESAAICKVGDTTVINPGAVLEGKYALMTAEKKDGKWSITSAELKSL